MNEKEINFVRFSFYFFNAKFVKSGEEDLSPNLKLYLRSLGHQRLIHALVCFLTWDLHFIKSSSHN